VIFEVEQLKYHRSSTFQLEVERMTVSAGELICIVGPKYKGDGGEYRKTDAD
jgi:ABC-type iron transport system FetAB ATPase subunit